MTYTTMMTSKGQITVPVAVRRKLGLKPGNQVGIELDGNTAKITASNWEANLAGIQARMQAHLQSLQLHTLTDEKLDQLIDEAGESAANDRYNRSLER